MVQTSLRTSVLLEDATDAANSDHSLVSSFHPSSQLKFHNSPTTSIQSHATALSVN